MDDIKALFQKSDVLQTELTSLISMERPDPFFNENQGGCTDGKYYYQTFMHRDRESGEANNRCKIAKIDLATMDIVQWSGIFTTLNHCNDIVYNEKRDILVLCHNNPNRKRISLIDPHTLTLVESFEIEHDIYAIDYCPVRDLYVVTLSKSQNLMFYTADFRPLDGVVHQATDKTVGFVTQGICSDENYIYCSLFDAKGYRAGKAQNVATVYDWNGDLVGILELNDGMREPENMSIRGDDFYLVSCEDKFELFKVTVKLK